MRNQFIQSLTKLASQHDDVFLLVGDLGYSVVEEFADQYPDRFINVGVAEQNMLSISAGLASEGVRPYLYSIANFPTFRAAEQYRNDIDYHNYPVTVVSVGGGLSYGNLGYSHHAIQDYGLMRLFPNTVIASPGDPLEVSACMEHMYANPKPYYLRLAKAGEPHFHKSQPSIAVGDWSILKESSCSQPIIILCTGNTLGLAFEYVKIAPLADEIIIASVPLWGSGCKKFQINLCNKFNPRLLLTLEDHLYDAGFGSWFLEATCGTRYVSKVRNVAISAEICGLVGDASYLHKAGGLTINSIEKIIDEN